MKLEDRLLKRADETGDVDFALAAERIQGLEYELESAMKHKINSRDSLIFTLDERDRLLKEIDDLNDTIDVYHTTINELSDDLEVRKEGYMSLSMRKEKLEYLAAEMYQIAGALDLPEKVLDKLAAAANGDPIPDYDLLPFHVEES